MTGPRRHTGVVDRRFFALLLCLCVGIFGCPTDEVAVDEGAPETDCNPTATATVEDEMQQPACSDVDEQVDVPPPAEGNASCTTQVGGMTVTTSAQTSVTDSVVSASCSMENGGSCTVQNACSFPETEQRDYVFTLDATRLELGQSPTLPDGGVVQGSIVCQRSGGGAPDIFPLVAGEEVDVLTGPGDSCSYGLSMAATGALGATAHVVATLTRRSIGSTCVDDGDCENPFYSHCQPNGICASGRFPDTCIDDDDCAAPNYVCTDDTCELAPDNGELCANNDDCDGVSLCNASGSCSSGRAVALDNATGTLPMATRLCLSDVGFMGCTFKGTECQEQGLAALHLHREISIIGQTGTFPDPNSGGCGHGKVFGDDSCGVDFIPSCQ